MSPQRFSKLAAVAMICCLAVSSAQAEELAPQPLIEFPASSDFLVLELTSRGGATVDPQQGPFLRIYGDGRIHVRNPPHVRRDSGDFESYLSHYDLQSLLSLCASKGLMEFDDQAVELQREAAERAKLQAGSAIEMVSDSAHTNLTIRLSQYAQAGSDPVAESFEKTVSWYALSEVVSWYPEVKALAGFQEFVEVLSLIRTETVEAAKRGETLIWLPTTGGKR